MGREMNFINQETCPMFQKVEKSAVPKNRKMRISRKSKNHIYGFYKKMLKKVINFLQKSESVFTKLF